jgi:biotin carboxylase
VATLLFLGASVSQLPAIRHARHAGHRIVAVDGDPAAVAFADADVAETVDFADVAAVCEVAHRHRVNGVLAVSSDRAVVPAAAVADALGLPSIGPRVARSMTDKLAMRARLRDAGLRQPRFAAVREGDAATDAVARVGLPAVLKPADSGGQRGVFLIHTPGDLEGRLPETLAHSRSGRAILEEFLPGDELNCLLVVRGGEPTLVTLSDRLRPEGPGFGVGWAHVYPSMQPAQRLDEARAIAFAAVRTLGLRDGIAFPQLLAGSDGLVRVVEIAARIPAGQMADLVRLGTGVDLYDVAIAQALGRPVSDELVTPSFELPVAIRFLTARPGVLPVGVVAAIGGLDEIRRADGVLAADLYFDVGHRIRPLQVDADRLGYVAATGRDPADALAHADLAARRVDVRTIDALAPVATPPRLLVPSWLGPIALAFALVGGSFGLASPHARAWTGGVPSRISGRFRVRDMPGRVVAWPHRMSSGSFSPAARASGLPR